MFYSIVFFNILRSFGASCLLTSLLFKPGSGFNRPIVKERDYTIFNRNNAGSYYCRQKSITGVLVKNVFNFTSNTYYYEYCYYFNRCRNCVNSKNIYPLVCSGCPVSVSHDTRKCYLY